MSETEGAEPVENQKVVVGMLVAILVLGVIVGGGYFYSRTRSGQSVLPAGFQPPLAVSDIDCTKPRPSNADLWDYYTKCDPIKFDSGATLVPHTNTEYNFSFNHHSNIELVPFPNGVGIPHKEISPQNNLLYSVDLAANRSGELSSVTGEDYVRNYWRQYPGLAGIKSLEAITNSNSAKGYKAVYLIGDGREGKQEVFFELGDGTGNFVHFTSGILDQKIYDTIIGSFKYPAAGSTTPQPSAPPTSAPTSTP